MLDAVRNAFRLPDLRQKLLITFGLICFYRLAANIPLPGVDQAALAAMFSQNDNILLNLLNFFSGGGLARMGVMALGVYPYITASIILQLLIPIIPALEELSKEGESGPCQDQPVHAVADHSAGRAPGHRPRHAAGQPEWLAVSVCRAGASPAATCCRR